MSTPRAKRALNFGTPNAKRQKTNSTMVVYRGLKPEMKYIDTPIVHTTSIGTSWRINNIASGAASDQRVGTKIKMHHIEGVIVGSASQPVRIEIYNAFDASVTGVVPFGAAIDRKTASHLRTIFMHNGCNPNLNGYWLQHKLPGTVARYADTSSSSCNSNAITVSLSLPVAATVTGYLRLWYTDA